MVAISKIMAYTVALLFLVIILVSIFAPDGYLPKTLAKAMDFIAEKITFNNIDSLPSTEVSDSFGYVQRQINTGKLSNDNFCFISLQSIASSFGDFSFVFEQSGENMILSMYKDKTRKISQATIEDSKVCAVYGTGSGINFYNHWLRLHGSQTGPEYHYFNRLILDKKGIKIGNEKEDFEVKYLYKIDDELICFVPSHKYISWAGDCEDKWKSFHKGIDDDCVSEMNKIAEENLCKMPVPATN